MANLWVFFLWFHIPSELNYVDVFCVCFVSFLGRRFALD